MELLRAFRRAARNLDQRARVLAVDCSPYSSAFHEADQAFLVPRCSSPDFVPRVLELCARHRVDLVVPTIDPELPLYAAARQQFAEVGTTVAVSSPEVVEIAADKRRTHQWLTVEGFPTVLQTSPDGVDADADTWAFPLVAKPRFGSASVGVTVAHDRSQLARALADAPPEREMVVQSLARGTEHTIDVLVTASNGSAGPPEVAVAVPRRRIEVRAGEVAKAATVRSPDLIELAEKLCSALPGAYGPLNLQVFAGQEPGQPGQPGQLAVIEINARFGGGFPLSWTAGADMPLALLQDALGLPITTELRGWQDNLVMLRYDAALYVDHQTLQGP